MKAFLLALGVSVALMAPAWARDYDAVVAFDDAAIYLDPSTVKTEVDIKTFWSYTVYISTNGMGNDWTSELVSVDCKNDRIITHDVVGYGVNGVEVATSEDDPSLRPRWIDIPPETEAAGEAGAVCHGNVLGTDSGASFLDIVPIARRRLIQIAAEHPQPGRPIQQTSKPAAAWRLTLRQLGRAMQQTSTPPPPYISSGPGTEQPVYSAGECIGPIVAGVCQGAILPSQATHPVCHGEMVNGTCTGPMF